MQRWDTCAAGELGPITANFIYEQMLKVEKFRRGRSFFCSMKVRLQDFNYPTDSLRYNAIKVYCQQVRSATPQALKIVAKNFPRFRQPREYNIADLN